MVAPRGSLKEAVLLPYSGQHRWRPWRRSYATGVWAEAGGEAEDEDEEGAMEMLQIGTERPKNVLILMSDTGGGHRASAEAIRDAFHLEFGDDYRVRVVF